jgi:hypothetical protein
VIASPCSHHEVRRQARVAGDSILLAIVLTPENASCRPLRGLRMAKDTIHPRLHGTQGSRTRLGLHAVAHYAGYASTESARLFTESPYVTASLNHREFRF